MVDEDGYENVLDNATEEASDASETTPTVTLSNNQCISDMDNEELCKWIRQMGASEKTLVEMRSSKIEGAELVYAINTNRHTAEDIRAVRRQLGVQQNVILCMRIERRIFAEIEEDKERRHKELADHQVRREHELAKQIERNQYNRPCPAATSEGCASYPRSGLGPQRCTRSCSRW